MQLFARHALDGVDLLALSLGRQHQARAGDAAVYGDGAGAAVAGAAAFLAAGQPERPAQHVEHALFGVAQEFLGLAVDRGGNVKLGHDVYFPPARWAAMAAARFSSTPATLVR